MWLPLIDDSAIVGSKVNLVIEPLKGEIATSLFSEYETNTFILEKNFMNEETIVTKLEIECMATVNGMLQNKQLPKLLKPQYSVIRYMRLV